MNVRAVRIQELFPRRENTHDVRELVSIQSWLYEVNEAFKFSVSTFALCLNLINDFFSFTTVSREKLQVSGLSCLYIASGINEMYGLSIDDAVYISDGNVKADELLSTNIQVIHTLHGKLRPLTAIDVLSGHLYEKQLTPSLFQYARDVAIILYTYYPKYWRLTRQSMANICKSVANQLLYLTEDKGVILEAISNLKKVGSSSIRGEKFRDKFQYLFNQITNTPEYNKKIAEIQYTFKNSIEYTRKEKIDCKKIEQIGQGGYGEIYRVKCNDEILARKTQPFDESALQELSILSTYQHSNIISMKDYDIMEENIDIYMEIGRSLEDILYFSDDRKKYWESTYIDGILNENILLPEKERRKYILDICRGVDYLHRHGVMHRDLKPGNVIVVNDIAKIADFGTSTQCILSVNDTSKKLTDVGSKEYAPPELLYQNFPTFSKYSFEIDIWSLACVITEIETGIKLFFWSMNMNRTASGTIMIDTEGDILKMQQRVLGSAPKNLYATLNFHTQANRLKCIQDEFVRDTLLDMLNWEPKKRLSSDDVLERFETHY